VKVHLRVATRRGHKAALTEALPVGFAVILPSTLDALARQPALGDLVRPELLPVREVRRVSLDDGGQGTTVAYGTDTTVGPTLTATTGRA
jgi:hypothetical protein